MFLSYLQIPAIFYKLYLWAVLLYASVVFFLEFSESFLGFSYCRWRYFSSLLLHFLHRLTTSLQGGRRKHDRHLFLCTKECFHRKKLLETGWQNIKVFRNVTYCMCTRTCVKLVLFKTAGKWLNDSSRSEKQGTSQQYNAYCVSVCVCLPVNRQCMLGVVSHSSLEEHKVKLRPAGVKDRVLGGHERERLFSLFKSDCLSLHPSVPSVTGRTLCPGSSTCYTSGPAWSCLALHCPLALVLQVGVTALTWK